jgi:hypothetical protein
MHLLLSLLSCPGEEVIRFSYIHETTLNSEGVTASVAAARRYLKDRSFI